MSPLRAFVPSCLSAFLIVSPCLAATGSISAELAAEEPVLRAWALRLRFAADGVYHDPFAGTIADASLRFDDLPLPGRYRLRLQTASGVVEGWNARVPESDYVEEQPLSAASLHRILQKTARNSSAKYADKVVILDIQGNIQHAAALVTFLRKRPFVGGGYKPGEWTWRVERWEWEDPMEHTWTVVQERPYYALLRTRFYEADYRALRTTYARHLGGIELSEERPAADLGRIVVPRPRPGTHAINPDGTPTRPFVIKPWTEPTFREPASSTPGDTP